jgi:hypothetical protein
VGRRVLQAVGVAQLACTHDQSAAALGEPVSTSACRRWIEMPAEGGDLPGDEQRPKYPIEGRAVLVYRGSKVYVGGERDAPWGELASLPDVRELTVDEIVAFELSLPFPLPSFGAHLDVHAGRVGLGDVVSWLAGKLGFQDCHACRERRRWLNRMVVWGWWRR